MLDRVPVVAEVDVLVVGGSSGGIACALAAAIRGRSVYVVASRSYLGEDIAADFDYWLRDEDAVSCSLAGQVYGPTADGVTPPTPMYVKRTLDQQCIHAGVDFVFNSHPVGTLRDANDRIAGVMIGNRNGYQIIVATEVVDATQRGLVARQAGHVFTPPPQGLQRVRHVTVGGQALDEDGIESVRLSEMISPGNDGPVTLPAYRHALSVDMCDGSVWALGRAYAEAVDRCWRPGVWQHSERLGMDWPDRLAGEVCVEAWSGPESFPLGALEVEAGLWLLGPTARVAKKVSQTLCRPAHIMAVGERLGKQLADREVRTSTGPFRSVCAGSDHVMTGEIRVLTGGLRPASEVRSFVDVEIDSLPRLGTFDVVVIGGGTAGAPAGIAAARAGASTLVCETCSVLGGVGTAGQISMYYYGNVAGFTTEIDAGAKQLESDSALKAADGRWTPSAKQAWYLRELRRAGGEVWFNTVCCGAWVKDDRVCGVIVAGPHGYGLIEAGAVVDSSGNADVAAAAGATTTGIGAEHAAVQGTGLAGMDADSPYRNSDHSFSDDTDLVDATAFHVSSRQKFTNCFDCGQLIDSRERRQIVGDIELDPADFLHERRFPDSISLHSSNFDTHGYTVHPLFMVKPPDQERMWVYVPYRCLLPKGLDGLLVTGLGVSAHRDAIPVIRMQPDVQNQGYAAGKAAAMAAMAGIGVRDIDIKRLQQHLVQIGNLPASVLTDGDTFPVDDTTLKWAVEEGWDEARGLALCFAESRRAAPLLRKSHDQAENKRKVRYALMLALMGDAHGRKTLYHELVGRSWDAGWNYRGMHQFGMSMSEIDAMLIGLGRIGDAEAWPAVFKKIATLGGDPAFSHCRAVAEACECLHGRHPNPKAARMLAELLGVSGLAGHARTTMRGILDDVTADWNETGPRNASLREIHLARALYRCGDVGHVGRTILQQYADDLRGHFARHARAILDEPLCRDGSVVLTSKSPGSTGSCVKQSVS